MSNDLQRAMAEGIITLLDAARNHPGQDNMIDRKTMAIRELLDADQVCKKCNDTGECYYGFADGTPIASSLGPCVCVKGTLSKARHFARIRVSNGWTEKVSEVTADGPDVLQPAQYYKVFEITPAEYAEFNETGRIPSWEHRMHDYDTGVWLTREESEEIMDNWEPTPCEANCQCQSCCSPNGTDCGHG